MKTDNITIVDISAVGSLSIGKYSSPVSGEHTPLNNVAYYFNGSTTLSENFSISTNGDPFAPGDSISLWFTCNMSANGHSVIIQGVNLTSLIAIGSPIDVLVVMKFNGKWYVECTINDIDQAIEAALAGYTPPVTSVAGRTGDVTLTASDVGLGSVNNTSDIDKPVSTAQSAAISAAQTAATAVGNAAQTTANTASTNATSALTQITALTGLVQVATWAAGTQTIVVQNNLYVVNVSAVNGNIDLNVTGLSKAGTTTYAELKVILNFTGSYTVSAGTGCAFNEITGTASTTTVLNLIWNGTVYVQA